jgi:2-polyprenyl-6-methoxyphenol hydroxylase-like FAD-dependent oxidoreductase
MTVNHVLILGGGISGVAAALSIIRDNQLKCTVFEIRSVLSTIGGAVNLTPNALRYLDHLGVLDKLTTQSCEVPRIEIYAARTGKKLSELDFDHVDKFKFRARRVLRYDLLNAMIKTLKESGGGIQYGTKAISISHSENSVNVSFEDGSTASGDILLGCDGIHSFVRTSVVEPDRKPSYSGISNAYGMLDARQLSASMPFETTGMYSGRNGSLMMSFYDPDRTKLYTAAVMETQAATSREGWKVKAEDQSGVKKDILRRFSDSAEPLLAEVIGATDEWFLYPVYRLSARGKWSEQRCLLLGDAAHAVRLYSFPFEIYLIHNLNFFYRCHPKVKVSASPWKMSCFSPVY